MSKTIEEINQKINDGSVCVVTAEEMIKIVKEKGKKIAANEVDVVTTGTFGAMCGSGAFLNFGHADPPIKMEHLWLNDVHAYHGNAAVDAYIGATRLSNRESDRGEFYGGGHVIEDLVARRIIHLKGTAYATDCYPRTYIETDFTIEDLNQAILCNPRNGYQRYNSATNSTKRTLYTYMGKLLPEFGNATFSGAGELSPLQKDPTCRTIGIGTRIFLGGGTGYVMGEGTQHNPNNDFRTLFLKGNMKEMSSEFLKGAYFTKYGCSLYVGFGIPIPILDEHLAESCARTNEQIMTQVVDYGVPRRTRPKILDVSYADLYSGEIRINGKDVKVSSLSSVRKARQIAGLLKDRIKKGKFYLTNPVATLPDDTEFKPMKVRSEVKFVDSIIKTAVTCNVKDDIKYVANLLLKKNTNHIIVIDEKNKLKGFLTSFDIARGVAKGLNLVKDMMMKKVFTTSPNMTVAEARRIMAHKDVNSLPVIDKNNRVLGIITAEDLLRMSKH
ncbi:MAG: CBS domain-containing protein [Candidatus Lokiarchaeota archaeon]|nr:CBS domain-containing protein [Candidatus Lokiarchaeota archaeon]